MKKTLFAALCASTLGLGACDLGVPDLNNPSIDTLKDHPTPSGVYSAATGLLIGGRNAKAAQNGYVAHLGILGRESYTFDGADPRYVTEMLAAPSLDPGSPAFGGNLWAQPYTNIRNANTVLAALDKVVGVSDEDKKAIRGYALTQQALDFLAIVSTRDENGGPIDVGGDPSTLAPIESKEQLLAHIDALLDEGKPQLEGAGAKFPFPLSSGYAGFDTPKTFLQFNRAVKARVAVYRKDWAGALQAVSESFLDTQKPLTLGVYYAYGTGSGDTTNGLNSPNIYAHPSIVTDADKKANGAVDDRVTQKIRQVDARTYQDLTSKYAFTMYQTNSAPVPIIRNEELILLRAEANIGLGNVSEAAKDINFIRTTSGGLEARTDLDANNILDELLKQRRYSLLFEGGHRWIDLRRYGKLNQLPLDLPSHHVHDMFPIPVAETDARQ
ncbi:MAG: RagB/SusD family nutrient uptake outer membrane protein [Hyalangium sp.]|uniref:RagB/SusD family nutrient uptake outer membrane protein n=1 Tax=Hyalangium sp. TaxID=2028555 RepID=UPI00389B368E